MSITSAVAALAIIVAGAAGYGALQRQVTHQTDEMARIQSSIHEQRTINRNLELMMRDVTNSQSHLEGRMARADERTALALTNTAAAMERMDRRLQRIEVSVGAQPRRPPGQDKND